MDLVTTWFIDPKGTRLVQLWTLIGSVRVITNVHRVSFPTQHSIDGTKRLIISGKLSSFVHNVLTTGPTNDGDSHLHGSNIGGHGETEKEGTQTGNTLGNRPRQK